MSSNEIPTGMPTTQGCTHSQAGRQALGGKEDVRPGIWCAWALRPVMYARQLL